MYVLDEVYCSWPACMLVQAAASYHHGSEGLRPLEDEGTAKLANRYMTAFSSLFVQPILPRYQFSAMFTIVFSFSEIVVVVLLVLVLTPPKRWHRKGPSLSPSLKAEESLNTGSSHQTLPFLDFSPDTSDFRCTWPYTTKGRKCRRPIDEKTDRLWANTLRNTIADGSPHSERVEDMLREYAEFCICRLHRPSIQTSPEIVSCWVQQWLVEIRTLHDSLREELGEKGDAVGDGILLFPLTTIPEPPPSDGGSPGVEDRSTATYNTPPPLRRETSDPLALSVKVPGSFPHDDAMDTLDWQAVAAGQPGPAEARRSSTPATPSPNRYSQAIRDSPHGVRRITFRRISSATPRLQSTRHTAEFEPYPNKQKRSLLDVLNTPLGKNERNYGYVYIFTRHSGGAEEDNTHSLYVKIGVAKHVGSRFEGWKSKCRYKPHLEYHTTRIPNAMRVELLVHTELIAMRQIEQRCSGCSGRHDEWFKTDIDTARPVVERWAQWMQQEYSPYTEQGQLSSHVVKEIFEHKVSKRPLTSRTMLALTITTSSNGRKNDKNNVITAQRSPALSSPPPLEETTSERRHHRTVVASIEAMDPAASSPCVSKSRRRKLHSAPPADSTAAAATWVDEEERCDHESTTTTSSRSPSPSPIRAHTLSSATIDRHGRGLAIKKTRDRISSSTEEKMTKQDPRDSRPDIEEEDEEDHEEEVQVEVEPDDDAEQPPPFISDMEMSE